MIRPDGTTGNSVRSETDSFGAISVPADAYWGAQTQRSMGNFPFAAHERMPLPIIHGLAVVKLAAARVNRAHGLDAPVADAIETAAQEVIDSRLDDQFPLAIWQTGSGTQTNMNVNEVIAGRANELLTGTRGGKTPVHPNDHVNRSQSSNDSFPTALHVATTLEMHHRLLPAMQRLEDALFDKAKAWDHIIKIGRTHLQDATPLTLGQEFSGYTAQLRLCRIRTEPMVEHALTRLAQGGTAVGTGLNAPAGFADAMAREISAITGLSFVSAPNKFEALASNDVLVDVSGRLNTLAVALTKIANDIRLLGSGPRSGLGELILPANEPGSSIMPGKVNPVIPEAVTQVAAQVIGNDAAITVGGLSGAFELNVYIPMMARNLLESFTLLANVSKLFAAKCIDGLVANEAHLRELAESSPSIVTPLNSAIGYEEAAAVAKQALKEKKTIRQTVIDRGLIGDKLSEQELDKRLDVLAMAKVKDGD